MSARANYFKIGLFVIVGAVILIIGVVTLGAGALFKKYIPMETYINESVQGLDVGSPVKHLGVQIGNVKEISFVDMVYKTNQPYVYVQVNLNAGVFGAGSEFELRERLAKEIQRGLRIRLAAQGLTGAAYLELDYKDPERSPHPPIDWEPQFCYIPSAPSLVTRVTESVDQVFRRLEKTHIEQVVEDLDIFLVTLTDAVKQARVEDVQKETVGLLASLRKSSERFQELVERPDLDSVPENIAAIVSSARRTAENIERDLEPILANLNNAAAKLDSIGERMETLVHAAEIDSGMRNFSESSENLRRATADLPQISARMVSTLESVDDLLVGQRESLEQILDNIRDISRNIKSLTDDASRYPSGVLFGEPPARPEVVR